MFMGFFKKLKEFFSGNKEGKRPSMISQPQQPHEPKPAPKPYTATIYYRPFTTLPFTILENQIVYTEGSYN